MRQRTRKADRKLPDYVYLKRGRYVRVYYDPGTQKQREKRLCSGECTLAEVWDAYQGQSAPPTTLASVVAQFERSPDWMKLAAGTRRDYGYCRERVCAHPTNTGSLGEVVLTDWTPGLVRRYIDRRGETSISRANHELRWLKRVLSWAYQRDLIATNPAKGVSTIAQPPRQHYVETTDYMAALAKATNCGSPWLAPIMELAYRCRMRSCEVLDLRDAELLEHGIHVRRRKGSKDSIVEWSPPLRAAVAMAKEIRTAIIARRHLAIPVDPKQRYLFVSQTGGRLSETTLATAWQRLMSDFPNRFTLHDLKRKGVSDAKGDKLKASGHRSAAMLRVYDVLPDVVAPSGE